MTIEEIKARNRAAGYFWFEPDTMRFFGTRVLGEVYGGRYFVTSEKPPHGPRAYAVRRAGDDGDIVTIGKVCQYRTAAMAKGAARIAAAAGEYGRWSQRGELTVHHTSGDDP